MDHIIVASAYALLAKEHCLPKMRKLLRDHDASVRSIAACGLAYYHDTSAVKELQQAASGKYKVEPISFIRELEQWHEAPAVPVLMEFLQNDQTMTYDFSLRPKTVDADAQMLQDEIQMVVPDIPAFEARRALKSITGYNFPADVGASLAAWEKVRGIDNPAQRRARLVAILGDDSNPISGRLIEIAGMLSVEITNRSTRPILLERQPYVLSEIEWNPLQIAYGGTSTLEQWGHPEKVVTAESFSTLAPGDRMTILLGSRKELVVPPNGYKPIPQTRSVVAIFNRTGESVGLKAWIGKIPILGTPWDVPQVEFHPNATTAKASPR